MRFLPAAQRLEVGVLKIRTLQKDSDTGNTTTIAIICVALPKASKVIDIVCVFLCVFNTPHPHKTTGKRKKIALPLVFSYRLSLIDSFACPDQCAVRPVQATPPEDCSCPPVPGDGVQSGPHVLPAGVPATGVQHCAVRVRDGREQETQASGGSADPGEGPEGRGPPLDLDDALHASANRHVASAADLSIKDRS